MSYKEESQNKQANLLDAYTIELENIETKITALKNHISSNPLDIDARRVLIKLSNRRAQHLEKIALADYRYKIYSVY